MRAIIFVTDDDAVRTSIARRLGRSQHTVRTFDSGEALLEALDHEIPDIIFLDLKMPGMDGLETLKRLCPKAPQALTIMLTAYGTVEVAVEAMKLGAYDFLIKSVDLSSLDPVVNRAMEFLKLQRRVQLETQQAAGQYALSALVAESPKMRMLVAHIQELARNAKTTVLLQGETGTGKEFIARVLHHNSPRQGSPFVGVNCTAIPQELFESELFGYERGAFTGAYERKPGLCEQAEGGTLFLDEIGDLNLAMQAKLLRVLQERSLKRLGGRDEIEVEFRLIAATNRDLRREVAQGRFREDLFYRLNVVTLELPPLRERAEDILPLAIQALIRHSTEFRKDVRDIDAEARALLERYSYPGNIRELHNIIERGVIFCKGKVLTASDLPHELHEAQQLPVTALTSEQHPRLRIEMVLGKHTLEDIEQAIIEETVRLADFNKSRAAKLLNITRFALDRRLKKAAEIDHGG
ncbi:MAG: sigma-54-dependent Fis family transcriptional regulator [Nitrospirae bacterium]|nr:MAG: sigma-54-dependent Fis family transcriptional regulator [Nitrospirota bacterium]